MYQTISCSNRCFLEWHPKMRTKLCFSFKSVELKQSFRCDWSLAEGIKLFSYTCLAALLSVVTSLIKRSSWGKVVEISLSLLSQGVRWTHSQHLLLTHWLIWHIYQSIPDRQSKHDLKHCDIKIHAALCQYFGSILALSNDTNAFHRWRFGWYWWENYLTGSMLEALF